MKARAIALALKILALVPVAAIAFLVWRWGVNVLYWDEWDLSQIFLKQADGRLSLDDFTGFHNESRPVFPRLVFLALGHLSHWNLRANMAATFAIACALAWLLHRLRSKTFPGHPLRGAFLLLLTNLLLFSPSQVDVWLWGLLGALLVPVLCLLLSLLIIDSPDRQALRLAACIALAFVATFSFANGLLCWVLFLPALILKRSRPGGWTPMIVWLAAFAVTLFLFFHHPLGSLHERPPSERLLQPVRHPALTFRYFLLFLSGPFAPAFNFSLISGTIIGFVLFASFVLLAACAFKCRNTSHLFNRLVPWLILGSYSILSAALAASSRSADFDASQALAVRYSAFAIYLPISLVHLAFIAAPNLRSRIKIPAYRGSLSFALTCLVASILLLLGLATVPSLNSMRMAYLNRRHARAVLHFLNLVPPQPVATALLYPDFPRLQTLATNLNARGFFHPPLLDKSASFNQVATTNRGELESAQQLEPGARLVRCWALSPSRHAPADVVLFTYENTDTPPTLFALTGERLERPDLAKKFGSSAYSWSGWQQVCRAGDLPKGTYNIHAWSFDFDSQTAGRLKGSFSLTKD